MASNRTSTRDQPDPPPGARHNLLLDALKGVELDIRERQVLAKLAVGLPAADTRVLAGLLRRLRDAGTGAWGRPWGRF